MAYTQGNNKSVRTYSQVVTGQSQQLAWPLIHEHTDGDYGNDSCPRMDGKESAMAAGTVAITETTDKNVEIAREPPRTQSGYKRYKGE